MIINYCCSQERLYDQVPGHPVFLFNVKKKCVSQINMDLMANQSVNHKKR